MHPPLKLVRRDAFSLLEGWNIMLPDNPILGWKPKPERTASAVGKLKIAWICPWMSTTPNNVHVPLHRYDIGWPGKWT